MNIGYSGRLPYDKGAYDDKLKDMTGSVSYRVNPNYVFNCDGCLSTLGPRAFHMGYGVSTPAGNVVAAGQHKDVIDLESELTNRNLKNSKLKSQEVNFIDVSKYGVKHAKVCNHFLDPMASRIMNPPCTYREMAINRFYDLNNDPQTNIYWDGARNTKLEAKDNFKPRMVKPKDFDATLPKDLGTRKCARLNAVACYPS